MPFTFESQRLTLLSKLAQTDYLTAISTSDPTVFKGVPVTDKNFAKLTPKVSDNADDAQGNDFATEEFLQEWDSERDMEVPVTSEDIGYDLLAGFGSVATSQPAVGTDPTVYQHVFTLQDGNTSRQLPARTLVEILGTAYNALFPSMVTQSISMKGDGTGRVMNSVKLRGSGKKTVGSGVSVSQALAQFPTGRHYFFNSQAGIVTTDNNASTNSLDYGAGLLLNSWGWELDNDLLADDAFRPGTQLFQGNVQQVETLTVVGNVTGSGTLTMTVTAVGMNNSPKNVTVNVTSGDTSSVTAGKIKTALSADVDVSSFFRVSASGANVSITAILAAPNDSTMNLALALGTATGVTAVPTSVNTTAGVYDPTSGQVRAECLFGRRKLTINEFSVRANDQTKELADLLSRRPIDWKLTLTGATISHSFKHQLVVELPLVKYDVVEVNAGGKIAALKITPKPLYDVAQNFAIKATLTNTVTSYTS